jgi:ferredoxin
MSEKSLAIHYVCTYDEAKRLIDRAPEFCVSNCGCREGQKRPCARSRHDVCLMFDLKASASGSGKRPLTRAEAEALLNEARGAGLVCRPFRTPDRSGTEGVCFCCNDCCGYFLDPQEKCDRGKTEQATDPSACTNCGACVDICFFQARKIGAGGELNVDRDKCYGCGNCLPTCPVGAITLAPRS